MNLYSTYLQIEDDFIPYQVYKESDRLFFKPLETYTGADAPIFWVSKASGAWMPINIHDERFIKQIQENISKHYAE